MSDFLSISLHLTSIKKLLGAPVLTTRSKNATRSKTSNKKPTKLIQPPTSSRSVHAPTGSVGPSLLTRTGPRRIGSTHS